MCNMTQLSAHTWMQLWWQRQLPYLQLATLFEEFPVYMHADDVLAASAGKTTSTVCLTLVPAWQGVAGPGALPFQQGQPFASGFSTANAVCTQIDGRLCCMQQSSSASDVRVAAWHGTAMPRSCQKLHTQDRQRGGSWGTCLLA